MPDRCILRINKDNVSPFFHDAQRKTQREIGFADSRLTMNLIDRPL